MFRQWGNGATGEADRLHGVGHLDQRQPLRQRDPQTPTAPVFAVAADPLNLPPLDDLPSSLAWGEGEYAGRVYREALVAELEKTLALVEGTSAKTNLSLPDFDSKSSIYDIHAALADFLLAPLGMQGEGEAVLWGGDSAFVAFEDGGDEYFNAELDLIAAHSEFSEQRKDFLTRLALFTVHVNRVIYCPWEVKYFAETIELYQDEVGEGEDPLIPFGSGGEGVMANECRKQMEEMEKASGPYEARIADDPALEADLAAFDAEPEFRDEALLFLRAARRLGDLFSYVREEDYDGGEGMVPCFFYVTPVGRNVVNDFYASRTWDEMMQVGVAPMRQEVPFVKWPEASARCAAVIEDYQTFKRLFVKLLCNIGE